MIHVSYLYDCQPLLCLPNSESIVQAINDGVRFLGTNRNFFIFLSDAARYMASAGTVLKSLYP